MPTSTQSSRNPTVLVTEFHEVYGLPIRTEPVLDVPERKMRVALVVEEMAEYAEAERTDDLIEIADALGDLVYVAVGAALAHGFNIHQYRAPLATELSEVAAKVTEPTLGIPARRLWVNRVRHQVNEYVRAEELDDFSSLRSSLAAVVENAYGAARAHGIDLDEVLQEIQRSNMSKLDEAGKPIYREDGKVLKGANFFPPDIETVLERQRHRKDAAAGVSS